MTDKALARDMSGEGLISLVTCSVAEQQSVFGNRAADGLDLGLGGSGCLGALHGDGERGRQMQNFGIIFRLSTLASLRSRWFWGYTIIIFGFIALIFSSGVTDSRVMGFTGLTRLLVIFIQACNLVLPVFILVSTVRTLVKERETNVFEYLLSYPISLGDYYWGKAACAVITTMVPLAAALAGAALWSCFMGQTASVGLIALYTALLLA